MNRQRTNAYRRRTQAFRPGFNRSRRLRFSRPLPANKYARGSEVKALDTPIQMGFTTAGTVTCLNEIQAGSSFYNRIGRRIEIQSAQLNLSLKPVGTNVSDYYEPDFLRIMLVYDSQTNGAIPALADILQSVDQTGAALTSRAYSLLNLNNRDRFTVIRDIKLTAPSYSTNAAGEPQITGTADQQNWKQVIDDYTTKCKGCLTQYKADSNPAVIGDISTGALYLVTTGIWASDLWGLFGSVRLRFKDI